MVSRSTSSISPASVKINLPSPIAVVCHDAGATNLIVPWLKAATAELRPVMKGPASVIWARHFPDLPLIDDIGRAMQGAGSLLSGTGWASSVEHDARVLAGRDRIRSIAVLDHWVNYADRFERSGTLQLPDELWVTDAEAENIARREFKDIPVRRQPNHYLEDQLARISPAPGLGNILYVLEPVRDDWGRGVAGEFQALEYAMERLPSLGVRNFSRLILRPHPSEDETKYSAYLSRYSFIEIDRSDDIAMAISDADAVIGVESFALTIALQAGRPVFSSLPPWAPEIRLPHRDIIQVRNLRAQ